MFHCFLILSTLPTHVICSYAPSPEICPYTRLLLQAFHRNCCIFLLISSPQSFLHNFLSSFFLVLDPSSHFVFLLFSLSTWYPEFIEYWPLGLCFQISLSIVPKELIGTLSIIEASVGLNDSLTNSLFHPPRLIHKFFNPRD